MSCPMEESAGGGSPLLPANIIIDSVNVRLQELHQMNHQRARKAVTDMPLEQHLSSSQRLFAHSLQKAATSFVLPTKTMGKAFGFSKAKPG